MGYCQQTEFTVGLWNKLGILAGMRMEHAYNGNYFLASGELYVLI